jgi:PAS domain S-box-containing protein
VEPRELVGRPCYEYMHRTPGPPPFCPHSLLLADGREHCAEVRELDRDFLVTASPLHDRQGKVIGSVHVARDITERKQAEAALKETHDLLERRVEERTKELRLALGQLTWEMEERQQVEDRLRESEARFASFMQNLPGLALMKDIHGRYLYANETWEKVSGKKKSEWLGKTAAEVWPADRAKRLKERDMRVLTEGRPLEAVEIFEQEDGPHYWLGHRFPILDKDGQPFMVGVIGIDITARQKAEEALENERRRLFAVLETLPGFVCLLAPDYTLLFTNRVFRERLGEPRGRRCYELLFGRSEPCENCQTFNVLKTRGSLEWEWTGPDGCTYAIFDYPFADADGSPLILRLGIDITARKRAEEARAQLIEILEATPDFVASADVNGQVIYINRAGRRMLGVGPEEDISQVRIPETHPREVGNFIMSEALPAAQRDGVWRGETVFLSGDGREIPASQVILAHKTPEGRVQFFSTIARDITERKQAEAELHKVNRALRTLSEANQALVRATDEAQLFQEVCRVIVDTGGYRLAWVGLAEADKEKTVRPVAQAGYEAGYLETLKITWADTERGRGPTGRAIRNGNPVVTRDIASDPHFGPWRADALKRGYASSIVFPLITHRRVWGALNIYAPEPEAFGPEEMKLLSDLADNVAFGISALRAQEARKRSAVALRESEEKLRFLTSQLLTAQEEERSRLSRELHDELGQSLLVLKMQVRGIERQLPEEQEELRTNCRHTIQYIDEVIDNVRRLSRDLSPSILEDLGLMAALKHLLEEFSKLYDIRLYSLEIDEVENLIPKEAQINIFRIFQECLTNIGKHAQPQHVAAAIKREAEKVSFMVEDNGVGFNVKEVLDRKALEKGLGLAAMDERVRMLGGSFHIWSQKGAGTRITFTIPASERGQRR